MSTGLTAYKKISTMGMSQIDLVLAVYRGTLDFIDQAKEHFEGNAAADGRTACERARKCLVHLYTTLDMDRGGDIAAQLGSLYAYTIEQLDVASANKDNKKLDAIREIISNLRSGWEELKQSGAAAPSSEKKSPSAVPPDKTPPAERRSGITVSA